MPAYDSEFSTPAAPVARVTLRSPDRSTSVSDIPLLIDSGADVTLVPQFCAAQLGVNVDSENEYELMGFDGTVSLAPTAQMELVFLRRAFRGRFLLIPQDRGVLGRDVLNHVSLLLDGPRLKWTEQVG